MEDQDISAAPRCCARLLRRATYPASLAGPIAVRSTQFGAGDMVVVMDIRGCKQDTDVRRAVLVRRHQGGKTGAASLCSSALHNEGDFHGLRQLRPLPFRIPRLPVKVAHAEIPAHAHVRPSPVPAAARSERLPHAAGREFCCPAQP